MPTLNFSNLMTANQLGLNPFSGWQYEYVPRHSRVTLIVRSTTAGNRLTLYAGAETLQERSNIQGGGTAGTTPSPLNTTPIVFFAAAGDRLKAAIDEVLGGTPTVDGIIQIDPL